MKDSDFAGIAAGLEDAIAFVRGDTTRGRIVAGPDVRAIRAKTKLRIAPATAGLEAKLPARSILARLAR